MLLMRVGVKVKDEDIRRILFIYGREKGG